MSAPVGADDAVAATARYLRTLPAVLAVVGTAGDPPGPLIVQDEAPPREDMAGTTAAVIALAPAVGGGTLGGTAHGHTVRLMLELWADPRTDAAGLVVEPAETRRRLVHAYLVIDAALHRPHAGTWQWGDLRVTGRQRLAELTAYEVPGTGGLWRGTAFYAVGTG